MRKEVRPQAVNPCDVDSRCPCSAGRGAPVSSSLPTEPVHGDFAGSRFLPETEATPLAWTLEFLSCSGTFDFSLVGSSMKLPLCAGI